MRKLVLDGPKRLTLADVQAPEINDNELLIQVRACGISRFDLERYTGLRAVDGADQFNLGQDVAGVVQRMGKSVTGFSIGDRVLAWDISSGFSEYVRAQPEHVVTFADSMSFEEGALTHLLPPILYGMEQWQAQQGVAFVSGAGATGLLSVQIAKLCGVSTLFVADPNPFRLRRALDMGASFGINSATEDVSRRLIDETDSRGVDLSMECAGDESSFRTCESALAPSGALVVLGSALTPIAVNLADWQIRYLRLILGTVPPTDRHDLYIRSLELVTYGAVTLRPLLTHVFPLRRATEAFQLLLNDPNRAIKITLVP